MINYKNLLIIFGGILDITHEKNDITVFNLDTVSWNIAEQATKWVFAPDEKNQMSSSRKVVNHKNELAHHKIPSKSISHYNPDKLKPPGQSLDASYISHISDMSQVKLNYDRGLTSTKNSKSNKILLPTLSKTPRALDQLNPLPSSQHIYKSTLQENLKKNKLMKKMMLLNEFNVTEEEAKTLRIRTPMIDSLMRSIQNLPITACSTDREHNFGSITGDFLKSGRKEEKIKVGVKPVGRDGHTATLLGNRMFIFGGDRHKVPFNDLFALDLTYFGHL